MRRIDEVTKDRIVWMWRRGRPGHAIARIIGCSLSTAQKYKPRTGVRRYAKIP